MGKSAQDSPPTGHESAVDILYKSTAVRGPVPEFLLPVGCVKAAEVGRELAQRDPMTRTGPWDESAFSGHHWMPPILGGLGSAEPTSGFPAEPRALASRSRCLDGCRPQPERYCRAAGTSSLRSCLTNAPALCLPPWLPSMMRAPQKQHPDIIWGKLEHKSLCKMRI